MLLGKGEKTINSKRIQSFEEENASSWKDDSAC